MSFISNTENSLVIKSEQRHWQSDMFPTPPPKGYMRHRQTQEVQRVTFEGGGMGLKYWARSVFLLVNETPSRNSAKSISCIFSLQCNFGRKGIVIHDCFHCIRFILPCFVCTTSSILLEVFFPHWSTAIYFAGTLFSDSKLIDFSSPCKTRISLK